ncbi:hypothetical protein SPRG_12357 [Saprolegnia parasitica CBS 223.65]|uniref:GST N-terminal domain-containing protein n=1 Tax=Saprolegnia parasitica (strain CBS 223.65) TaxID=695850 RepID=A0A067C4X0_SAPPC|nr:hypothetical protein SPRG_12357 [Saprolegnia parasitica CBS 223.65]KDO21857.1 hypothetical protein SPRG_12357 [Saprolegnia parasitica CBS 223.65]|eukprot:XP_012207414.1 hypothetical protein SPRG_12357 [Saprolegnia parasitica CBS 223.65]
MLTSIDYHTLSPNELEALKTSNGLTLFNNTVCPLAHRALWTAAEVQAPLVRIIEVPIHAAMPASYIDKFNRFRSVPCLLDDGLAVYESMIVAQYLDAKFNDGKLFVADDPAGAALSNLVVAKFDIVPSIFAFLRNKDAANDDELQAIMLAGVAGLERIYREDAAAFRSRGPYLLGDRLSQAEIALVPHLFRFSLLLRTYRNTELLHACPLLAAALEAATKRPAFQAATCKTDVYLTAGAKVVGS